MNRNSMDDSSSPQTGEHERPSKRSKLDVINTPTLNTPGNDSIQGAKWERIGLMRELDGLRTALSNTEATTIRLRKMRKAMEDIFDEEEKVLEIQAKVKKESIEHLRLRLGTEHIQEACESQATADAEVAPMESRMREKIKKLLPKTARINERSMPSNSAQTPTSSNSQENEPAYHTLPEVRVQREMERIFDENIGTLESKVHYSELREVDFGTEKDGSASAGRILSEKEKKRANELEGQLQSAKDVISALREALQGKIHFEERISKRQKESDDEDGVGQQVVQCRSTRSGTSVAASNPEDPLPQKPKKTEKQEGKKSWTPADGLQTRKGKSPRRLAESKEMGESLMDGHVEECDPLLMEPISSDTAHDSNSLWEESSGDESSSIHQSKDKEKASETGNPRKVRKIIVGEYHFLPSDKKFFKIDWENIYRHYRAGEYICNKCDQMTAKRITMEDHIWVKHFGGHFECHLCRPSRPMTSRTYAIRHMRNLHPDDS